MTSSTFRLAHAMIETVVADFINSGYMAMVSLAVPKRVFRVAIANILEVEYHLQGGREIFWFTLRNEKSGSTNVVMHTLKRGSLGETKVLLPLVGDIEPNWLTVANTLAQAVNVLYQHVDALGEVKVLGADGRGFCAIIGDDVAGTWDTYDNNRALGGRSV